MSSRGRDERSGTLRLEGQLLDEAGQPVVGARVAVDPGGVATTDATGTFLLEGLTAGVVRITARKCDLYVDSTLVQVRRGREPVTLRMRRGATLALRVLDDRGPVRGASIVQAEDVVATTDADGVATVRGLGPAFQLVEVTAAGFAPVFVSMWRGPDPGGRIERTVRLRRGATVAGVVVASDGRPVPDATVDVRSLDGSWGGEVTTDGAGAWSLDALAGSYVVSARSCRHAPSPGRVIDVDGTTPVRDVVIAVEIGACIAGVVVDAQGAPVADATVEIHAVEEPDLDEHAARSDPGGRFEVGGLAPGAYRVFARTEERATPWAEVAVARTDRVEVRLALQPAGIAGQVVTPDGRPVAAVEVSLCGNVVSGDVTDAQGRFDLGALPPDDYEIRVEREDDPGVRWTVRAEDRDVHLVLPAAGEITGRVLFAGAPMPMFGILCAAGGCTAYPHIGEVRAVRDPDGRFAVRGLRPGSWGIVLAGPGTARTTIAGIEVSPGAVVDLGELELRPGSRVTGHVRDAANRPVAGARVRIGAWDAETDPPGQWFRGVFETTTDAEGAYAFEGVAPLGPPLRRSPVSARHPDHGASIAVAIPDGPDVTIDLQLVATGGLDGVIEGYSGPFASVFARRRDCPDDVHLAPVDRLGAFHLDHLPAGEYVLEMVTAPGRPAAPPTTVTVIARQRTTTALVMP